MENLEKLNHEINEFNQKYDDVLKRLDTIEKDNHHTVNTIKSIENSFAVMNDNMSVIMKKIDCVIGDESEDMSADSMLNKDMMANMGKKIKRRGFSLMSMITRPIRKMLVFIMSSLLTVTDYISIKFLNARERLDDMVAQAQYESRKSRSNMATIPT